MARRVFFSFQYDRDIWRANQARNSWVTQDREDAGFFDASLWEEAKRKGEAAINAMIDAALANTSVTVVLIGTETAYRTYVQYEIAQSHSKGKGLLGVYIHDLKTPNGATDPKGPDPFAYVYVPGYSGRTSLAGKYRTYDWAQDRGYVNFGTWVEAAAKAAGR